VLEWFSIASGAIFFWSSFVVFAGLAAGMFRRRNAPGAAEPAPLRFACVICAHNEEHVIERPVKSILAADYPAEMRSVFVFARSEAHV
jgi:cellulose synthase/poly-beta-1,6-N-acetylglucosamine synthase-like glycosyltransferase